GAVSAAVAEPSEATMLDCPLRDAPWSVETPLMDVLLSPRASAIVNRHMGGVLEKLPPQFASAEAPSFSAILDLKALAGMAGLSPDVLAALDAELAKLELTDVERTARCKRYDDELPDLTLPAGTPRLLLFQKITGFLDEPSVAAATTTLYELADAHGWSLVETDRAGVMTPESLARFDAVIWNNTSGDVLTLSQRAAFRQYIEAGGGFVGIHGAGGDPVYFWDWYVDTLLGARFIGHSSDPQFQDAKIVVEQSSTRIAQDLAPGWTLHEEWYSFANSPRESGATVIATLDEGSYSLVGRGGQDLRMGDHPIVWTRCVGQGRSFYSAIGHRPQVYADERHRSLLKDGVLWAAGGACADTQ
ncbi:MAG: ThuA domain-containing protein, partial [Halioglobus sp.]|nr:ThuA domain-containing protein [Halioglobus sp.]